MSGFVEFELAKKYLLKLGYSILSSNRDNNDWRVTGQKHVIDELGREKLHSLVLSPTCFEVILRYI